MAAARSRIMSGTAEGTPEDVAKVEESYTGDICASRWGGGVPTGGGRKQVAE